MRDYIINIIIIIAFILILAWFINLGVNTVSNGQKKVELYQEYLYSNDR